MTGPSLDELEHDVDAARTRLAQKLRTLRAPGPQAEFTRTLKDEAVAAKDQLKEQLKDQLKNQLLDRGRATAESMMRDGLDRAKAAAARHPLAVAAIVGGIGWRLVRHPPISSALIGAGLVALLRPQPSDPETDAAANRPATSLDGGDNASNPIQRVGAPDHAAEHVTADTDHIGSQTIDRILLGAAGAAVAAAFGVAVQRRSQPE